MSIPVSQGPICLEIPLFVKDALVATISGKSLLNMAEAKVFVGRDIGAQRSYHIIDPNRIIQPPQHLPSLEGGAYTVNQGIPKTTLKSLEGPCSGFSL